MAVLILKSNGGEKRYTLRALNTMGRHPGQGIQILDRIVSKEHALITYAGGDYWIQDRGSRNGTYVNGQRIQGRTPLSDRDEVTLGNTTLSFLSERPEQSREVFERVTISSNIMETAIRSRLAPSFTVVTRGFLPETEIEDEVTLRADYEKLRIAFRLNQAMGSERDIEVVLDRILETAFEFTSAERGTILLLEEDGTPVPRAVRYRDESKAEPVSISRTILNEVLQHRQGILSSDATLDSRFGGSHSIMMQGIRSTLCVPLIAQEALLGLIYIDTRIAAGIFTEQDLRILNTFAQQAADKILAARLALRAAAEALARDNLSRLLSPNLVEQIIAGNLNMERGGESRQASVLYLDIRGFTALSQRIAPQKMVDMLNEYFEIMVDIIFRFEGTLDKFIGDEIMAVWGAPVAQPDHARRAVGAALQMMKALDDFNTFRIANSEVPLRAGCGINCGEVLAGQIGSSRTASYTVMGSTVNLASRLCGCAAAGEILVSTPMLEQLGATIQYEERPAIQLKGIDQPTPIYRILGVRLTETSEIPTHRP
ncbi:FHA domain-containing protein [Myxococcota bacterium]|nr:FHA domain-containing protein [Myxococcota bacterium]MBU1900227.1 FHA domain-containing protein [Myxococcota bacterium]